ncbi:hypothetical protein BKA62DRAFT_764799 [Auriculariales sp. MPI-PUGE-AT-0066]|nr:hypothetical protein BKA62DRAFT_764799 [Auriculariales sp. MPI-PUGE-AT-0066]
MPRPSIRPQRTSWIHLLPDELLKEILSLVLHVPSADFRHTAHTNSPFANVDSPTAADILLVCKHWLRLATPLLYHTVIVRSAAQEFALCTAIANERGLGPLVRRLRLEGVGPRRLGDIAPYMTKLDEFALALEQAEVTKPQLLDRLLRSMNPRHFVLAHSRFAVTNLPRNIYRCIAKNLDRWDNLRSVTLPQIGLDDDHLLDVGTVTLNRAPTVEDFYVTLVTADNISGRERRLNWLVDVVDAPRLKRLIIRVQNVATTDRRVLSGIPDLLRECVFFQEIGADGRLYSLDELAAEVNRPVRTVDTSALNHAPSEVRDSIWMNIIRFAAQGDSANLPVMRTDDGWPMRRMLDYRAVRNIVTTCEQFAKYMLQVLIAELHLDDDGDTAHFAMLMHESPHLSGHVELLNSTVLTPDTLDVISNAQSLRELAVDLDSSDPQDIAQILSAASKNKESLETLRLRCDHGDDFTHLQQCHEISELHGASMELAKASLESLSRGPLTHLDWRIPCLRLTEVSRASFNFLVSISTDVGGNDSILLWLALSSLPTIKRLEITAYNFVKSEEHYAAARHFGNQGLNKFIERHGSKLVELIIDVFSTRLVTTQHFKQMNNLEKLSVGTTFDFSKSINCPSLLPKLKCLNVRWMGYWSSRMSAEWSSFRAGMQRGMLPALEEVHYVGNGFRLWGTTDHPASEKSWPVVLSKQLQARGITLYDSEGKQWKPRLSMDNVRRRSSRVTPKK